MPQNITLVLTPRQAADAKYYTSLAARRLGMPEQDIALVRVVANECGTREHNGSLVFGSASGFQYGQSAE